MSLTPEWTTALDGPVSQLNYHEVADVVTAVLDGQSSDPEVAVLSAVDGEVRGTVEASGESVTTSYWEEADLLSARTDDDHVYVIDPCSGSLQWETQASRVRIMTTETAYLSADRTLWAYRIADGARQWRTALPDEVGSSEVRGRQLVVRIGSVTDDEGMGLVGVDPDTGDEEWRYRPDAVSRVYFEESGLYARIHSIDDGVDNRMVKIDPSRGTADWSYEGFRRKIEFDDGQTYIVGHGSSVSSVDTETGTVQWTSPEFYDVWRPSVDDGAIFACVADERGDYKYVRLDESTGRPLWRTGIVDEIRSEVTDSNGNRLLGTRSYTEDESAVYRLNEATGTPYWEVSLDDTISTLRAGDPVIAREGGIIRSMESIVRAVVSLGRSPTSFCISARQPMSVSSCSAGKITNTTFSTGRRGPSQGRCRAMSPLLRAAGPLSLRTTMPSARIRSRTDRRRSASPPGRSRGRTRYCTGVRPTPRLPVRRRCTNLTPTPAPSKGPLAP